MKGLNGWLRLLEGNQSAVLSSLLKELDSLTRSEDSSGLQVGAVIMRDANLTSNMIRVGNSALYNAGSMPVTTVSRAILNIGFDNIRSICVSIKLLESIQNDNPSDLLMARLATTLHAASQAKALVKDKKPSVQEEVFVATLFTSLTELLVLASEEAEARDFEAAINSTMTMAEKNAKAEKTLGVSLTRLAKTLMKRWRIEGLVHNALLDLPTEDPLLTAISDGNELARCAQFGWDSPEFKEVLKHIAERGELSLSELKKNVKEVAEAAEESVAQYGNVALAGKIVEGKPVGAVQAGSSSDEDEEKPLLMPNPSFQLKALQELTNLISSPNFNINRVFKTILIGLNKGVGLERCCLAFFDQTHLKLVTKIVQGAGTESWNEKFVLSYARSEQGFLYQTFKQDRIVWAQSPEFEELGRLISSEIKGITGCDDFFIAPLVANGKRVGLIYADMGNSSRSMSPELFDGFKMFIQQAKVAMAVLASRAA